VAIVIYIILQTWIGINYGMILIETAIGSIILVLIFSLINNAFPKGKQINRVENVRSLIVSSLIAFGIIILFRYIFGVYRFIDYGHWLVPFYFAIMASIFYPSYRFFLVRFGITDLNRNLTRIFNIVLGIIWIIALVFLSIILLNIEMTSNPLYDAFLLGFEWAFFVIIFDLILTYLINKFIPIDKRIQQEVLKKGMILGSIIAFGIWSIQLIVVELYLKRLTIVSVEQDIRILILVVSGIYTISFLVLLKSKFLPEAVEKSNRKIDIALKKMDTNKDEKFKEGGNNVILDVQDLTTYFYTEEGIVKAVENISFKVFEGEVLGLVGETGCGKSVTALSILQLIPPPGKIESGRILFNNENLIDKSQSEMVKYRGKDITMIFQDPLNSLNPVYKVGDQISEVFLLHMEDQLLIEASKYTDKSIYSVAREWTNQLLNNLNIPSPELIFDMYPHELSGGMRQRVQIAIGLACGPKLLIADEPTTALDVTIQNQILKLMKELKEKYNTSILFITHDLGIISKMCDRVAVMYSGFIVEYGANKELFRNPKHPYTHSLIASVPIVGKKREELEVIPGTVPNLIYPPLGCRFHPRCKYRFKPCDSETPKNIEIKENYFVACHLFDPRYKNLAEDSIKKVEDLETNEEVGGEVG